MSAIAPLLFPLYVLAYLAGAVVMARQYRRSRTLTDLVLALLLLALAYDNLIIAVGRRLEAQLDLLYALSLWRYIFHGALVPFFVVVAAGFLARTTAPLRRWLSGSAWGLASAAALAGIAAALMMTLAEPPVLVEGVLRVTADRGPSSLPWTRMVPLLSTIVVEVLLMVVGGVLWRRIGWPWLLAVAVLTFVVAAAFHGERAFILMNAAEVLLGWGLVLTALRVQVDNVSEAN